MIKKIYIDWNTMEQYCNKLAIQILKTSWKPDYIVGIGRSGLIPAVMLSHILEIPMHSLKVTLRDGAEEDCDHNCWMAEDAFGYVPEEERSTIKSRWDSKFQTNILVVDDINDTGATFAWIKEDWRSSCLPREEAWDKVWGRNVRFATLVNNLASKESVDYSTLEINKAENDVWIVFPWGK